MKFTLEVTPPIEPGDLDLLTGASMTLLALIQNSVKEPQEEEPCGFREFIDDARHPGAPDYTGRTCVSVVGHKGRHRFRDPVPPGMN